MASAPGDGALLRFSRSKTTQNATKQMRPQKASKGVEIGCACQENLFIETKLLHSGGTVRERDSRSAKFLCWAAVIPSGPGSTRHAENLLATAATYYCCYGTATTAGATPSSTYGSVHRAGCSCNCRGERLQAALQKSIDLPFLTDHFPKVRGCVKRSQQPTSPAPKEDGRRYFENTSSDSAQACPSLSALADPAATPFC